MKIEIQSPLDMHVHFREGEMAQTVVPLTSRLFSGAVVMPNLVPPVDKLTKLLNYRREIDALTEGAQFEPYMTAFLRQYSRHELQEFKPHIIGIKLYPANVTTNSGEGISNIEEIFPTLKIMEEMGIPLLVHGESSGFVMDREEEFIPEMKQLCGQFPDLTFIMEHITTRAAVDLLDTFSNLYATITVHHLLITLDDVAGGLLQPHLFCKPVAKRPEDREALLRIALDAHPKVMFGSDSAPHPVDRKECCGCAAGVFTAPIALQLLADLFEQHGRLGKLNDFVSGNAQKIYGLHPMEKTVILERRGQIIPDRYGDVVPMFAGQEIPWAVREIINERL